MHVSNSTSLPIISIPSLRSYYQSVHPVNWYICQVAVEAILRRSTLPPIWQIQWPEFYLLAPDSDKASEVKVACTNTQKQKQDLYFRSMMSSKRMGFDEVVGLSLEPSNLDLSLMLGFPKRVAIGGRGVGHGMMTQMVKKHLATRESIMNSLVIHTKAWKFSLSLFFETPEFKLNTTRVP
uniref:Uncharacterized protein n=1 Tax=Nelumbo nucifera TaxID=4432 RepID=A0A822XR12_NELNU|nr:TPA_asm: hypothetical protein HUJ06_022859 [Nelumbo nucifera]